MTRRTTSFGQIALAAIALIVWTGCSDDPNQPVQPQNSAPTILSCTAEPEIVPAGETTTLTVSAVDDDGDALSYSWSAADGQFTEGDDGESVTWSPPAQMGTYEVTVTVDDGTTTSEETITLEVTLPEVSIVPTALDFGAETTSLTFAVANDGSGVLSWSADDDRDWASVDPVGGNLDAGEDVDVTVSVDRAGLAPGTHEASVSVTTPYGDGTVSVSLLVSEAPPALLLSTRALDFGSVDTELQFEISNSGGGELDWSVAAPYMGIEATPTEGTAMTETDAVTVTVDRSGFAPGTHEGTVNVTSNGGTDSVMVSLRVPTGPVPAVGLSPTTLDFGTAGTQLDLHVTNTGLGTLTWTANSADGFVGFAPDSGETTDETDTITVTIDRTGLAPGQHTGHVTVAGDGTFETATVLVTVPSETPVLTNLFFLHHSTGRNLINEGSVRGHLADLNGDLEFWDHDYNYGCGTYNGLRDPNGNYEGYDYDIPGAPCGNTDPDGLHYLWTTSNSARATILANHEVIAFKSCYPASDITSDAMLAQYKSWYLDIRDFLDTRTDRMFVVMSQPPRHRLANPDPSAAARARAFADWLGSPEFLDGHPNIVYFDFFDHLAGSDNFLRYEYERSHSDSDSHPNAAANRAVGPHFAAALADAAAGMN